METTVQVSDPSPITAIVVGACVAAVLLIVIAVALIAILVIGHAVASHSRRVCPTTHLPDIIDHSKTLCRRLSSRT